MAKATTKTTETATATSPRKVITSKSGIIAFPGLKLDKLTVLIIGTAPLIVHRFSEKARQMIVDKQTGEASRGRENKDIEANFQAARHRLTDGTDGIPAGGMKACIAGGADKAAGLAKVAAKGAIRVLPDDDATNLVRIITPGGPRMREDVVRNASGVVDVRHRPEYWPWAMLLRIEYIPQKATPERIMQAIETAGFTVGLSEWRPGSKTSMSGTFGTFRTATMDEIEAFEEDRLFGDPMRAAAE